ncbi:hypothetical protein AB2B38_011440 [Balneola sp. MJW-20]|uniref:hypothetical protein n=1 Tax=Gracilimonas aurantiaca TaxID=3234185 RepID=UPI0034677220
MRRINRKKWITALLALSCIASAVMLVHTPVNNARSIQTMDGLDSVIVATLSDHNIQRAHYRVSSTPLDTVFTRKTYRVRVPQRFSKTLLHYDLNKRIHGSGFESPSKVTLPEKDLDIYLYKYNSVVRTIRVYTDLSLDTLEVYQEVSWQTE